MASRSQEKNEEGHLYSGRHDHKLCFCKGLSLYICSGCRQYGTNVGFRCHECPDFILHEACATLPNDYVHPLYSQDPFHFRSSTLLRHHCDACGYAVKGFVFESRNGHPKLHPLCMALPRELNYGGHKGHGLLKLITGKDGKYSCMKCNTMNSNWRYQCENTACGLSIDFNCAKVDFLKLSDLGIASVVPPNLVKQFVGKISDMVVGNVAQGTVTDLVENAITGPVGTDEDGFLPRTNGNGPQRPQPVGTAITGPVRTATTGPVGNAITGSVRTATTGPVGNAITGLFGGDKDGSSPAITGPVGTATTRPVGTATTGPVGTGTTGLFGADKDGSSTATTGPVGTATTGPFGTATTEIFGADKDGSSTTTTGPLGTATTELFGADKDGSSTATTGPVGTATTEHFGADKDGSSPPTNEDGHPPPKDGDEEDQANGDGDGDGDEDADEDEDADDEDEYDNP